MHAHTSHISNFDTWRLKVKASLDLKGLVCEDLLWRAEPNAGQKMHEECSFMYMQSQKIMSNADNFGKFSYFNGYFNLWY